ncbi:hypothetical protein J3R82DRAFT_11804 [Butyriboletus roseoflavus]|nr:hypothetical protein J3R82DRAFT_11804 [Butyriboletus roseoflavus]
MGLEIEGLHRSVSHRPRRSCYAPSMMIKSASDMRKPYSGPIRALVVALDVGTTFSGVSYAILEPGEVPKIYGVTRFPGQEHVAGNSKIPSVLYYDSGGHVMCAGAETENASITSQAEDDGWIKAELFKLRLRPKSMKLNMNGMRLSLLPRHKTPVNVFGDFLRYLFHCTRSFIIDTHANGKALWQAVEYTIEFVLSHPNGWEGAQQTRMRRAAVYGGLIPDTDEGRARIRFVTEGEASLHACVQSGLAADVLSNPSKHGFLVADAGGGTLDISSYAVRGTNPLVIEEIAPPDCIFAGSVFVSRRAREFLAEKLKTSKYGSSDTIDHITKRFDETTKRLFRDKNEIQWVPFGSPLDKDLSVGIRGGSLKLTGVEVAELFEPSIQAAVASIKAQVVASQGMIKSVWLVGGFAASPWLFSQLQERLAPMKITVSRPDNQTSKAVADGALGFYCDHHVSARVSKFMYGVEYLREFDPNDPEHVGRKERLCELPSGPQLLPDAFDCILARSVKVKESTVFTRKYCTELTNLSTLSVFEVEIWCYRGGDMIPPWILRHHEDYSTLCVVRADLSPLSGSAEPKTGRNGKTYWTIVFSVEIHFGLTEFKARIKWNDNVRPSTARRLSYTAKVVIVLTKMKPRPTPEDDFGPSRSVSRAPSRPASVAASRTHSQDSLGSGTRTPQGSGRLDATFMDAVSRSRTVSISQSTHSRSQASYQSQSQPQSLPPAPAPAPQPAPQPQFQQQQQTTYTERTREVEREHTVSSSASRVSSSVTQVEHDRKTSSASKISSLYSSKSRTESEKEKRARDVAERERVALERDRADRDRVVAERERAALERDRAERDRVVAERERLEKERVERERDRAERERIEREIAEREREERERAEREMAEKEQAERERIAAAEAAAAARPPPQKSKGKGKTKNASKLNSPLDLADTTVGKSPGELANTLTSVWGSQSTAVTPAPSPFPSSARSMGPTTPRSEFPPTESSKLMPRDPEPTTSVFGEAPNASFADPAEAPQGPFEFAVSGGLTLDVSHSQDVVKSEDPGPGHTPADTVPLDQLTSGTPGELGTAAEFVETTVETSAMQDNLQETLTAGAFEVFGTSDASATVTQADNADAFGWNSSSWDMPTDTTGAQSTNESLHKSPFEFGASGIGSSLGFSGTFGGMGSIFGVGGGENKEFELGALDSTDGAPLAEQQPVEASPLPVAPPAASSSEEAPEPQGSDATLAIPGPTDETPLATEQSTTDNPTDVQGEEEQEEWGHSTKKGKKGAGGGGGGKKKKKGGKG